MYLCANFLRTLNYKVIGNNPDNRWVVMVHGAGGSIEVWFRQVPDFARHFNLLLVDLAGHGGSVGDVFRGGLNFEKVADQVMEVVDAVGIEKSHFMGLSLGSIIVRVIAERYAERVESMVLAGAVTKLNARTRMLIRMVDMFKNIIPYRLMKWLIARVIIPQRKYAKSKYLFLKNAQKLSFESFLEWMQLGDNISRKMADLFSKRVLIPTLYLMGENDHLFLAQASAAARDGGDLVSMVVVPNAGHICNVDNKSFFNRMAIDFFSKF